MPLYGKWPRITLLLLYGTIQTKEVLWLAESIIYQDLTARHFRLLYFRFQSRKILTFDMVYHHRLPAKFLLRPGYTASFSTHAAGLPAPHISSA